MHCLSAVLTLTVIQVAERTHFRAYIAYSVVITAFVYPVVSYWGWNSEGFLAKGDEAGANYHDFAGSGIVHMVGGCAGLVGAILVGPRKFLDTKVTSQQRRACYCNTRCDSTRNPSANPESKLTLILTLT